MVGLSDSLVAITVKGTRRDFQEDQVRQIVRRRSDSLWNGALIGLGVGAGVGLVGAGVVANTKDPSCPLNQYPCDVLGAIGAGITFVAGLAVGTLGGIVTDMLVKEHTVVYLPGQWSGIDPGSG
ncbi:MAG: hypothetical protein HYS05_13500 [Acidobacteria bacterium]|nr:hypothetical protein [Acidobacteriota bacterium]